MQLHLIHQYAPTSLKVQAYMARILSHGCTLVLLQLEAEVLNPPDVFPLIPIVNKSCNIECYVNNMLKIIQNMMVSQCSELELSMFRKTTISGQHSLI